MYSIPGSTGFTIDDERIVYGPDGTKTEGTTKLSLYGIVRVFDNGWLYWLSYRKLNIGANAVEVIDNLTFVPADDRYQYGAGGIVPVLKKRVPVGDGFYVNPLAPEMGINTNGDVLVGDIIRPNYRSKYYPTAALPDGGDYGRHVLVAITFIPNTDFIKYPIVNHIDGVKDNTYVDNLEWCDYSYNNQHAFETGLRTDNCPCKLRSFRTGEILHFCSLKRAAVYLDLEPTVLRLSYIFSNPRRLYKNEYELKFEDDNSPWYHVGAPKDFRSRYVITVTDSEGNETTHYGVRELIKDYKLWNLSSNVPFLVGVLRERRPDLKVEYEDRRPEFRFDLLNVKTKEDHRSLTLGAVKALTGINGSYLCENARLPPERVFRGWLIKYHDSLDWPPESTWEHHKARARRIAASRVDREEIAVFDSFRHCSKVLGIDRDSLKLRLRNNKDWNGWTFTEFED